MEQYHLELLIPALLVFVIGWAAVRFIAGMGK